MKTVCLSSEVIQKSDILSGLFQDPRSIGSPVGLRITAFLKIGGGILVLPAAPDKCPVENIQNHQIRAAQNRHGEEKAADAVTPPLGSGDEKNSGNRKAVDPHGIIGQRPNTEGGVDIINKHCRRCPNARFFPQAKKQQQADAQMGSHIQIPEPQTDALCASVVP